MSFVINQAKQQYSRALQFEICIIVVLALAILAMNVQLVISFLAGMLSSFLPFCLFVYLIFFKYRAKNQTKMTAFYRAEAFKWIVTIILVIACFKCINNLKILAFFSGYILILILNTLIPLLLSKVKN